jgi:hypothetical protein
LRRSWWCSNCTYNELECVWDVPTSLQGRRKHQTAADISRQHQEAASAAFACGLGIIQLLTWKESGDAADDAGFLPCKQHLHITAAY